MNPSSKRLVFGSYLFDPYSRMPIVNSRKSMNHLDLWTINRTRWKSLTAAPFSIAGGGIKIGVILLRPSDVRASICLSVGPFRYNRDLAALAALAGEGAWPFEYFEVAFNMSGFSITTVPFCRKEKNKFETYIQLAFLSQFPLLAEVDKC